jgi:hypothetical protein
MVFIDDDLDLDIPFDPLADQDELSDEEEEAAFIGLIEKPVEEDAPATDEPKLSCEERIQRLLDSIPAQRKVMLGIIDFCREPRPYAEVDDFTLELQKAHVSLYTPIVLRQHMETAGALVYVEQRGDGAGTADGVDGVDDGVGAADNVGDDTGDDTGDDIGLVEAAAVSAAEDGARGFLAAEGEDFDEDLPQIEYLEVTKRPEGLWVSTPVACALYDSLDYASELQNVLDEEPEYAEIFIRILEYCAETARGKSQLNDLVDNDPILLGPPRRYSGYFIDRLDTCNALEWRTGGWISTEVGRAFVRQRSDDPGAKPASRLDEGE